jgi:CBS domain-containing protein
MTPVPNGPVERPHAESVPGTCQHQDRPGLIEGHGKSGLDAIVNPRSVAVIGASERAGSVGGAVVRNLVEGGFAGPILPVNPKWRRVHDRPAVGRIADAPAHLDLAVICTPAPTVPGLRAQDVMVPEPVCVEPSTTIRQLARVFEENEISGAPVVDQEGRVIGVVSKTDLIRRCSEGTADIPPAYLFEVVCEQDGDDDGDVIPEPLVCVDDFMTPDPVTVTPGAPLRRIARLMFEGRIHRVVVVDEEKFPVGIITSLDMLGAFLRESREK